MADKQKGLIKAVGEIFPESEHRFCVRHMYSNFQQHFKGEILKNQIWKCARSSNVVQWNKNMEKLRELNEKAYNWAEKMPPNTWSRAFFSTYSKCDILLNNSCEVFNKFILEAREMPVLTMIEQIKNQLMARHYSKEKEVGEMWQGPICPKIRKKVNKISEWANTCYPIPSGKGIFEVQDRDHSFIVDIGLRTCECRRWDLTGIPCSHAISCLRHERISTESMVHDCYTSAMFLRAYGPKIIPCSDKDIWEKVDGPEVLPPKYEKRPGRPAKNRRKTPTEIETVTGEIRLSKHGVSMTCTYCGIGGHNRRGCKLRKAKQMPPKQSDGTDPVPIELMEEPEQANIYEPLNISSVLHQEDLYDFSRAEYGTQPMSQLTQEQTDSLSQLQGLIAQLDKEYTQASSSPVKPQVLPDSNFIISNLPAGRPVHLNTATKSGRNAAAKRKRSEDPKPNPQVAKKPSSAT